MAEEVDMLEDRASSNIFFLSDCMKDARNRVTQSPDSKQLDETRPCRGWLETAFRMGVTRPTFVASKKVTLSDTLRQQNRLLLPNHVLREHSTLWYVLRKDEMDMVKSIGMDVNVLDAYGRAYVMTLKNMEKKNAGRIIGPGWFKFVKNNQLLPGRDSLKLWAFRVKGRGSDWRYVSEDKPWTERELWLAITKYNTKEKEVEKEEEEAEDDDDNLNSNRGEYEPVMSLPVLNHWKVRLSSLNSA